VSHANNFWTWELGEEDMLIFEEEAVQPGMAQMNGQ
jgi:hypothetical protein